MKGAAMTAARITRLILIAVCVAALTPPARAVDTYWQHDPAEPGDWADPANWTEGLPDRSMYNAAYIDNGGTAVRSTGTDHVYVLFVGDASSGRLEQTGGNLYMRHKIYVGYEAGSSGAIGILTRAAWEARQKGERNPACRL